MSAARITGAVRRDETIARLTLYSNPFHVTWAADGRQLVSTSDGVGLTDPPRAFHANVYEVIGDPPALTFAELPGYPDMRLRFRESEYASYWAGSCLAVGDRIYQVLMTTNHPYLNPDLTFWPGFRRIGAKLIYSPDGGRTWHNQDGSHPVVWENWDARSRANMLFFDEDPPGSFASPSFLQMGRGYGANRDGYVYVYFENGDAEPAANELGLLRVPTARVLERDAYEYFAGPAAAGGATWTSDIAARAMVHTFPAGWVSSNDEDGNLPAGWAVNVVHNEPLGVYLMVAQGTGVGADGAWFSKPSYFGIWAGPTPWGPFEQIHEDTAWTPAGDLGSRAFAPQIVPKWIAPDGRSFWLVWADYQYKRDSSTLHNRDADFLVRAGHITDDDEFGRVFLERLAANEARTGFNIQRVDLQVE
ncbi:hypothetical protein [Jiangella anatolica]|uniref:DUF4185 domain-containing protein n=1 Tax=Jiangella anatolica TaxID=2670374 RepID=A0A2W2BMX7_9ACTN|nr:hypothetical protein [Jiangella anatolica]PZF86640.1 hypothetical protein C1I92_00205 [Jiangella anatolica]